MSSSTELRTARLLLRHPRESDLPHLLRLGNDDKAIAASGGRPQSQEAGNQILQQWMHSWRRDGFGYFCVRGKHAPDDVIGFTGVTSTPRPGDLNLFYWYSSTVWGHGFASEAVRACWDLAFNSLGANEVVATTHWLNDRAIRMNKALGMKEVARRNLHSTSYLMTNMWYWKAASQHRA